MGNICTWTFKQSILKNCDQRNDKWAQEVRMRVLDCHDLQEVRIRVSDCHDLVDQMPATTLLALSASLLIKIKRAVMQSQLDGLYVM